jgi:hypothetical protein
MLVANLALNADVHNAQHNAQCHQVIMHTVPRSVQGLQCMVALPYACSPQQPLCLALKMGESATVLSFNPPSGC